MEHTHEHHNHNYTKELIRLSKKQLFHSRIITVFLLCITLLLGVCAFTVVPKLNSILTNLSEISQEINEQDPVDVEALNDTLRDLNDVLGPLSGLFPSSRD